MRFKFIVICSLFLTGILFAQKSENEMSGVLNFDQYEANHNIKLDENNYKSDAQKKSVFLAGLMSAVVPGAGEFYTEHYIKAGIFIAVEAAAITAAIMYNNKGDDQTTVFENFANNHWSAKRYAQWSLDNLPNLVPDVSQNDLSYYQNNLFRNGEVNYNVLNMMERLIGSYYSHQLDPFGTQQYYEMIGKYHQFNTGWDDYDQNKPFEPYDPDTFTVTNRFKYYSGERSKANDFYSVAKTAVTIVILNHVISAIDAAWSASRYNKTLDAKFSLEKQTIGFYTEYYPQLNLKLSF